MDGQIPSARFLLEFSWLLVFGPPFERVWPGKLSAIQLTSVSAPNFRIFFPSYASVLTFLKSWKWRWGFEWIQTHKQCRELWHDGEEGSWYNFHVASVWEPDGFLLFCSSCLAPISLHPFSFSLCLGRCTEKLAWDKETGRTSCSGLFAETL